MSRRPVMSEAELADLEWGLYNNSTPVFASSDTNYKLKADTPKAKAKLACLINTLRIQAKYNKPDTLTKIAQTVKELEAFIEKDK